MLSLKRLQHFFVIMPPTVDINALVTNKEVILKMAVKDLKVQLELRNLRKSRKKRDLIKKLLEPIVSSNWDANDRESSTGINQVVNNVAPTNDAPNQEEITLCQPCQV